MQSTVDMRLVQFDPLWLEPAKNAAKASKLARLEAESGADLIVFPELSNIGYVTPIRLDQPPEYPDPTLDAASFHKRYVDSSETVSGPFVSGLAEIAAEFDCHVITGLSRNLGADLMNSAVLIGPSGVIGIHDKLHIPPQEKPFFRAGSKLEVFETTIARIGLAVCYDSRFPEVARFHARNSAEISVVVYAGADAVVPYLGTADTLLYRTHVRAQENGIFFAICNRVGEEGGSRFMGRSAIAAPNGAVVAKGGPEAGTVRSVLMAEEIDRNRGVVDVFADLRPQIYG